MQYLVPKGFPAADGNLDEKILEISRTLVGVDTKFVRFPNTSLAINLNIGLDLTALEFKKNNKLIYVNFFCTDIQNAPAILQLIQHLYNQYNLGSIRKPTTESWIYSVPVDIKSLTTAETKLCEKITVAYFWAVVYQWRNKQNTHN